jgi:ADP-heptose:LPS heptosyltransferase
MKKKILILRFSSIGDIVLTTPVPRVLKTQLKDVEVHFCTRKAYAGILQENPYIDKLMLLNDSLNDLIRQLKNEQYDLIIDLHHNLRTLIIKKRLGVKAYSFNKLNFQKWVYVNFKRNILPNVHIVDRYLDTIKPLGVTNDFKGLDYFIPNKDKVDLEWLPEEFRKEYVALVVGAKYATKQLPIKKIIQLAHMINKPVVVLGGKEDVKIGETLEEFFRVENEFTKTKIFNGCGKFNLNQSASLLKQANYVFTHDTGLMHIAAAFKKQIFSIWGNTTPHFGMYPYLTKFTIFENNKIDCRPCTKIGYKKCPKGHFKCMNDLNFDFYLP